MFLTIISKYVPLTIVCTLYNACLYFLKRKVNEKIKSWLISHQFILKDFAKIALLFENFVAAMKLLISKVISIVKVWGSGCHHTNMPALTLWDYWQAFCSVLDILHRVFRHICQRVRIPSPLLQRSLISVKAFNDRKISRNFCPNFERASISLG